MRFNFPVALDEAFFGNIQTVVHVENIQKCNKRKSSQLFAVVNTNVPRMKIGKTFCIIARYFFCIAKKIDIVMHVAVSDERIFRATGCKFPFGGERPLAV